MWVLIIAWITASSSAIHSVEFNSKEACEKAAQRAEQYIAIGYISTYHPTAFCVEKGAKP
jgi:hypothetical protein